MMAILPLLILLSSILSPYDDPCKGEMVDGAQHGHWQFYHENGNIALEGDYKEGHESGSWKMYDENGTQLITIDYGN